MTATRGPQVVLEGYARDVARGGGGKTMRDNMQAMDQLISAGLVADGNAVDGTSRTGGQAYDPVVAQFPHAPVSMWEVPAPLLNVNAAGGSGTITGPLGFWGASSIISNYDAKVWATGGATVPGNDGQGELNYMAGRHVFQGYDGTTQFRIANIPWSWQWWEASGGSNGGITTLRTGSDLNPDCSGAIAMQGHGNLTIGNGEGTIATFMNINAPIINYIQFQPGGYNQGVGIRAAGGDGLPASFAIGANYNGSVIASNSNGPMMVVADAGASGVSRSAYFMVTAPTSGQTPSIALSTTGITSPPTSLGLSLATIGNGGFNFGDGNGALLVVADGQATGTPFAANFRLVTPNAGGGAVIGLTAGSQSNENISLCSLGTGAVVFCTSGSTAQARVLNTASAVATVDILGAVSGGSPAIRASTGNLSLGNGGGIGTNATSGMIQIPYCAGTPTGVPTNAASYATMLYDATANKLWIYSGSAWRGAAFT